MELMVNLELLATGVTATIFIAVFAVWFSDRSKNRVNLGLSAVVFFIIYVSLPIRSIGLV